MDAFAVLAATWPPAESRRLGPWTLRRGAGGGSRVSAATLDGPLADPAPAAEVMLGWGQRPRFMLRPDEEALDAALASRGYAVHDPTVLLAASTAALAPARPDEAAIDCEGPLACMIRLWAGAGVGPERLAVMARAPAPRTWLLGRLDDRPAACAFVALHGRAAMLHALEVSPDARRRGLGARLTRAAAGWAREAGAATLALAVTRANAPARGLYAALGFSERARYHYRIAPQETP